MKGCQSSAWKVSVVHYNRYAIDLITSTLMQIFIPLTCTRTSLSLEEILHIYVAFRGLQNCNAKSIKSSEIVAVLKKSFGGGFLNISVTTS